MDVSISYVLTPRYDYRMIFLLYVRVLRVKLSQGKVKEIQVNRALVPWFYMTMKIGSNRREIRILFVSAEDSGLASVVFFFIKKTMHNFSTRKTEYFVATQSVAMRMEQWAYLVQSETAWISLSRHTFH